MVSNGGLWTFQGKCYCAAADILSYQVIVLHIFSALLYNDTAIEYTSCSLLGRPEFFNYAVAVTSHSADSSGQRSRPCLLVFSCLNLRRVI